jgi:hypothetical protein
MRSAYLIAVGLLVAASHTAAAQTPAAAEQRITHTIHSSVLGEDRTIHVFLPDGYRASEKYDVVYVLDAEMLVRFVPPIRTFGEINDLIPPVIIVGVDNL